MVILSLVFAVSLFVVPAQAHTLDPVCSQLLTRDVDAGSDTRTFINLVRALAVEKGVLTAEHLADLARGSSPRNPVQDITELLSRELAYSYSNAFERLIKRGALDWDAIRAELQVMGGSKRKREQDRAQSVKNTEHAVAVFPIKAKFPNFDFLVNARAREVFTSRKGKSYVLFDTFDRFENPSLDGWLVDLESGKSHLVPSDVWLEPSFFETSAGTTLLTYVDSKGVRVVDADTGNRVAGVELSQIASFKTVVGEKLRGWKALLRENSKTKRLEVLIAPSYGNVEASKRIANYVEPVWVDLVTKLAQPIGQAAGDFRYVTDHDGHIISYGYVRTENGHRIVVRDLTTSPDPILSADVIKSLELSYPPMLYRSKAGDIYVATHSDVVRIYSQRAALPQEHTPHGWNELRTFFEDEFGKVYYLLGEYGGQLLRVDIHDNTELPLVPSFQMLDHNAAGYVVHKDIRLMPGMGPMLIYQEKSFSYGTGVVAFYNLVTQDVLKMKDLNFKKETPFATPYFTADGQVRAVYKTDLTLELMQLFGPLKKP